MRLHSVLILGSGYAQGKWNTDAHSYYIIMYYKDKLMIYNTSHK